MDAAAAARLGSPDARQGMLGSLLREGRCRRMQNPGGDPAALDLPASFPPVHSLLAGPVVSPTRAYGWLCLLDKLGADEFSPEDERLAGMLAAQVGRTYENGSLYADVFRHAADLELQVAERLRAEADLRRTTELLRAVADETTDAVFVKDRQGRYLLCNPATARFFGRPAEEVIGKDDAALFDADSAGG